MGDKAVTYYREILRQVDAFSRQVEERCRYLIACRRGCSSCCILGSVNALEAWHLRGAFEALPPEEREIVRRRADSDEDRCVFLHREACLIYADRPVICRTHGLPILVEGRVDHCPKNFTGVDAIDPSLVLNLETLNLKLTAVNLLFQKDPPGELYREERITLKRLVLMGTVL